jgi:methyl-accepting chemotaxis protein
VDKIVAIFVIVAAVAIVIQMGILIALFVAVKQAATRITALAGRMEEQTTPILATSRSILDDAQPKISEITSNLAESSATIRAHVSQIAEASSDIVERAHLHAVRIDEFVGLTMDKIENTTEVLQHKVLGPVRRVRAIMQAVNAGLGFLRANRSRKKPTGKVLEEDEEMFI